MVRPGSVLEVGQLVGPVSELHIVCVGGEEGVEIDRNLLKLQLKKSGMDELINH